jgi:hypothetical protein
MRVSSAMRGLSGVLIAACDSDFLDESSCVGQRASERLCLVLAGGTADVRQVPLMAVKSPRDRRSIAVVRKLIESNDRSQPPRPQFDPKRS